MEYQKITKLLGNTRNQPTKFRKKNWVEINDDSRGAYKINSQIKCKTSMLRLILYDQSDASETCKWSYNNYWSRSR